MTENTKFCSAAAVAVIIGLFAAWEGAHPGSLEDARRAVVAKYPAARVLAVERLKNPTAPTAQVSVCEGGTMRFVDVNLYGGAGLREERSLSNAPGCK